MRLYPMIRRLSAALLGLCVLSAPALADCAGAWAAVSGPLVGGTSLRGAARAENGGCVVSGVMLTLPARVGLDVSIAEIRFDAASAAFLTAPQGGGSLDLTASGIRFLGDAGNADTAWLMAAQRQAGGDATGLVSLTWDAQTRRLMPLNLALQMPGVLALDLLAEVSNVDLSSPDAAALSAAGFAITRADLTLDTAGVAEAGLWPRIAAGTRLPDGTWAREADLLALTRTWAAGLPPAAFPASARAALRAWLDAMPRPQGRLSVAMTAPSGFGPARAAIFALRGAPQGPADLAPLFAGTSFAVTWQPGRRF